jgi:hypothetical protein
MWRDQESIYYSILFPDTMMNMAKYMIKWRYSWKNRSKSRKALRMLWRAFFQNGGMPKWQKNRFCFWILPTETIYWQNR